jgi:hypothetical protein
MLHRLTRALLPLAAFVALQGSLLGSAASCTIGAQHSATAVGSPGGALSDDMPGMDGPMSPDETDGGMPCEHDSVPARCMSMPACAIFIAAAAVPLSDAGAPSGKVAPLVALAPGFEPIPPELPPPRA